MGEFSTEGGLLWGIIRSPLYKSRWVISSGMLAHLVKHAFLRGTNKFRWSIYYLIVLNLGEAIFNFRWTFVLKNLKSLIHSSRDFTDGNFSLQDTFCLNGKEKFKLCKCDFLNNYFLFFYGDLSIFENHASFLFEDANWVAVASAIK